MSTLYILYGSATGNAEGIAKDLAEKQPPSQFDDVVCKPMGDFKKLSSIWEEEPSRGRKHGIILVCSTTGNGDAPENASRFVRYLKRKQTTETQPFRHCAFSVLGLGDTNYDQFCETGKVLDKKMAELGGERALPLACADEATGLEETVEPWLEQVHASIAGACSNTTVVNEEKKQEDIDITQVLKIEEQDNVDTSPKELPSQSDSPLFIMYGSATGNAEQIAKDLAATYEMLLSNPDAHTFFPSVICCELNQFKKYLPVWEGENASGSKHGLIVVASTTGNADAPENCSRFMRFIKRRQNEEAQPFRNVKFSVLGLGDSNYDVFCATGKAIDRRLAILGGSPAKKLACADEGTGLEDVVDPWTVSVLEDVSNACRGGVPQRQQVMSMHISSASATRQEEEKKTDNPSEAEIHDSKSDGVLCIKHLLGMMGFSSIPMVPQSMLPSLGASRSSCELFIEEDPKENMRGSESVFDTESSLDKISYTHEHPYEAKVIGARYLTSTETCASEKITTLFGSEHVTRKSNFVEARGIIESSFDLKMEDKEQNERNSKRVIELSLSLPEDSSLRYEPGDTIGLMVPNQPDTVSFMLENLYAHHGMIPTQKICIDDRDPVSVEFALEHTVDLSCSVRNRKMLYGISQFATSEIEATVLRLMSSKDSNGTKLYQQYVVEQRRSFVDILRDFPSCRSISIEGILSLLPSIPPRYYSICSSPSGDEKRQSLSIAFSVVDYLTPSLLVNGKEEGHRRIHGLATSFLEIGCSPLLVDAQSKMNLDFRVKIFPKPASDFRLPTSLSTPMVLIGPGTGIAPFMGFLDHRKKQINAHMQNQSPIGDVAMYFGCRRSDHDWLFKSEMETFVTSGVVNSLYTAFSREGKNQYVQDLMKDEDASNQLLDLLVRQNGSLYICGDGNAMARDVQKALIEIFGRNHDGSTDVGKGRQQLDVLKESGRFLLDIWS